MHFPFCCIEIAGLESLFRQRTFHYVSCRVFLEDSREETFFLFGRFIAYMRNLKICQGEACKIDKPASLCMKTL